MRKRVGNVCDRRAAETVPQSLISAEEKSPVFLDRPSQSETELVPLKRWFLPAKFVVFPLRGIQFGVAQKFEGCSMQLIRSGACDRGEHAAGRTSVPSDISICQHAEFADCVHTQRLSGCAARYGATGVHDIGSVQEETVRQ